jgi:hypothetical protein
MSSRNIEVSLSVTFVSIMKLCCGWHVACEIVESNGHTVATSTSGSCDIDGAYRRHIYFTTPNLVEGTYVEDDGGFDVSQHRMHSRMAHSV